VRILTFLKQKFHKKSGTLHDKVVIHLKHVISFTRTLIDMHSMLIEYIGVVKLY